MDWPSKVFPDPRTLPDSKNDIGIVAVSDRLTIEWLIEAYSCGIFPWPMEGLEGQIPWFCPDPRQILPLPLRINRSTQRTFKKLSGLKVSFDEDFEAILLACAKMTRTGQDGTWITPEITQLYPELFRLGFGICCGVYQDNKLVGGVYGVRVGDAISLESMFQTVPGASRVALVCLTQALSEQGVPWVDVQQQSEHTDSLGAVSLSRDEFIPRWLALSKK